MRENYSTQIQRKTNSKLVSSNSATKNYFLGETFEQAVSDTISGAKCYGVILPLEIAKLKETVVFSRNHLQLAKQVGLFLKT